MTEFKMILPAVPHLDGVTVPTTELTALIRRLVFYHGAGPLFQSLTKTFQQVCLSHVMTG